MPGSPRLLNWFLRRVFQAICRVDAAEIRQLPCSGPYILVGNHVNFLEVPLVISHLDNPMYTGMAKKETWENPFLYFLFNQWGIIPIDRDNINREAFQRSTQALSQGRILAISPEGTRSKDGNLRPGKPGVVALALRSGAPLIPIATYGYENFWDNLKHLRRTDFHLAVGKPFRLRINSERPSRAERQAITDEIMYKIAELLPQRYRGHYQFDGQVHYQYVAAEG